MRGRGRTDEPAPLITQCNQGRDHLNDAAPRSWRVAFALQEDGWILRNAIVWHKPNAMPESVRDRLNCRHELIFLLVKQPAYWFDLDPIRIPHSPEKFAALAAERLTQAGNEHQGSGGQP